MQRSTLPSGVKLGGILARNSLRKRLATLLNQKATVNRS